MKELECPIHWKVEVLEDHIKAIERRNPEDHPNDEFCYVEIGSVNTEQKTIESFSKIQGRNASSRARNVIRKGDIIYATVRPYYRNVALVPENLDDQICSTGFCVLRVKEPTRLDPHFLFYYLQSDQATEQILRSLRGGNYPAVTNRDVLKIKIPLPSKDIQIQIVHKLGLLLSEIRNRIQRIRELKADTNEHLGIKRIKDDENNTKMSPLLKRSYQRLLDAAFRGEMISSEFLRSRSLLNPKDLTSSRENANPSCANDTLDQKKNLPEIPVNWSWTKMQDLIDSMKNGVYKPAEFYGRGIRCLRMYNIEDGKIILKNLKEMQLTDDEISEYSLIEGDILLNRVNSRELVGKCAVVQGGLGTLVYESKNIRIRVRNHIVNPHYLSYFLQTTFARKQIENGCKKTAGMATVSQEDIVKWSVPLAPYSQQMEIVNRINQKLPYLNIIDEHAKRAAKIHLKILEEVDLLQRAVLESAFNGSLLN